MSDQGAARECRLDYDYEHDDRPGRVIPSVVRQLAGTCGTSECFDHVSPVPIPSREALIDIVEKSRRILFPGYFTQTPIAPVSLEYYLGQEVTALFDRLSHQIALSFQHDCIRYKLECSHCQEQGREKALQFLEALPEIRLTLSTDVRAAYEGDPACGTYDQIIYSYPGLKAVAVYRIANILFKLDVPLLPRIMTEYAHSQTGIDIHPGADIGESFFIDHGTGVVIGETCQIGRQVRLYQGVTLGALSLPRDAGAKLKGRKRHPTIEDEVIIYSGATILGGDTVIGARSVIGGNVWLTESVPPDSKVTLKAPELVFRGR
jgi:serine O-acetyltransferase